MKIQLPVGIVIEQVTSIVKNVVWYTCIFDEVTDLRIIDP